MKYIAIIILCLTLSVSSEAQNIKVTRATQTVSSGGLSYFLHRVGRGQTLFAIAKAYNVSQESILEKNPFLKDGVKVRQTILVPTVATFKELQKIHDNKKHALDNQRLKDSISLAQKQQAEEEQAQKAALLESRKLGLTRDFRPDSTISVVYLLPFSGNMGRNTPYNDFFRGSLLAMEELKNRGISTDVQVISCGASNDTTNVGMAEAEARKIIKSGALDKATLIIGPIYKDAFAVIAEFASQRRIPIVSPLSDVSGIESPYVFQATPSESSKYDKIKPLFVDANVVVLKSDQEADYQTYNEFKPYLPSTAKVLSGVATGSEIASVMQTSTTNVIVVPVVSEISATAILSRIESAHTPSRRITVIAPARWSRFSNLPPEKMFSLNTTYVTNYHEDRTNEAMVQFYNRYIGNFVSIPTMLSMRGYDVTLMFVDALVKFGPRMPLEISKCGDNLLQVKYKFRQSSPASSFVNQEWVLVNYHPNNKIIID